MSVNDVVPGGPLLHPGERAFLERVSRLLTTNPFEPRWTEVLRDALGPELVLGLANGSPLGWGPLGTAKDRLSEPLARVLGAASATSRRWSSEGSFARTSTSG